MNYRSSKRALFAVSQLVLATVLAFAQESSMITSSTHADQNAWYNSRTVSFSWKLPDAVLSVSTRYDNVPDSEPTKVYTPPIVEKTILADEDGVGYFHLQFKTEDGWGEIFHYKFQIDTEPPSNLSVIFPKGNIITSPRSQIKITATDSVSGLDKIHISIDGAATTTYPINPANLYTLPEKASGKHKIAVAVSDKAGNMVGVTTEYSIAALDIPVVTEYTKYADRGDVLKVAGTALPGSTVQIVYTNIKNDQMIIDATEANDNGAFIYLLTREMPSGVYELKVRAVDDQGAHSSYSHPRTVNVENSPLIRIGLFIMNWISLVLVIVLASVLVVATLWYSLLQFARFRNKVHSTMREAEHTLRVNVQALRRDIEEFHDVLAKAKTKRNLTKEETSIMRKFKKRLETAEKEIEKKLEQVG